jgi:hypothetical protein
MNFIAHAASFDGCFLADIGRVSVQQLSSISLIDERFEFLSVMD